MAQLRTVYIKVRQALIDGDFIGDCNNINYPSEVPIYGKLEGVVSQQRWKKDSQDYYLAPHELTIYPSNFSINSKNNLVRWTYPELFYAVYNLIDNAISISKDVASIKYDPAFNDLFPVCTQHDKDGYSRNKFIELTVATFTYPSNRDLGPFRWTAVYVAYRDPTKYSGGIKFLNSLTMSDDKGTHTFFNRYDNLFDLELMGDLIHLCGFIPKSDITYINSLVKQDFLKFIIIMVHKYGVPPSVMDKLKYVANGKLYTANDI